MRKQELFVIYASQLVVIPTRECPLERANSDVSAIPQNQELKPMPPRWDVYGQCIRPTPLATLAFSVDRDYLQVLEVQELVSPGVALDDSPLAFL